MEGFDIAQICLNGHVVNDSTIHYPDHNKDFCDKCGAKTITHCPHCNDPIRGRYYMKFVYDASPFRAPAYCHNCGAPYPWTEAKLNAAKELAEELERLTEEERKILAQSIDDLVKESPKTELAATRVKKLLAKAGKEGARLMLEILKEVASETAKKVLWGN